MKNQQETESYILRTTGLEVGSAKARAAQTLALGETAVYGKIGDGGFPQDLSKKLIEDLNGLPQPTPKDHVGTPDMHQIMQKIYARPKPR